MRVMNFVVVILFTIFGVFECQVHYVPAQILIPTLNGANIAVNHTINNTSSHVPLWPNNNKPYYNNSYNSSRDGHLIIGTIQQFDRLLFNQEYFKPRRWWTYRETIVEYPKDLPAGYSRHETISAIRVYNKFYDGNTARATIDSGGVGSQYAKIKLQSGWGNGFRYSVQILGH